ncbi:MAG: glucosamine/fructose-6-phosphate aminotransferase, isomerizing, glucosamine-fructose-6-phosphate aminotransferase (isomerizing) [Parcubacteria group bacterium GW2011_GWC1_45_14]|nr:MAG: Isomerizing Glutamine-fructose-6-phosphate aminotransferase [Candidatus Moranbacteria bacterium GW2011_GWC2_45_10]KKT94866.1 MAG: glucosamine/fructose-6-phosphate aminotransferase, isomerizing, glucosamine-fructose-6-phosphate aminotransferase (isomerizing) [Parcubacteria group bacterium GW2011_GWC1_45_14]
MLMCGIVGYVGRKKAVPVLIEGLKQLEYRGYDSAGISVVGNGIETVKATGKVAVLENKLGGNDFGAAVGIAHTRWATHGKPSDRNSHPHRDCSGKISLVHNGIIENYRELKELLVAKGHKFSSDTDSEVVAHLIEEFSKKLKFKDAVLAALNKIRGTYGLAILNADEPEKIYAARLGSPLLLGIGKNENIVASDASAIVKYTDKVVYLDDGEMAVVGPESYEVITIKNKKIQKKIDTLDWSIEQAQKQGFDHFMLKEIFEQPEAVSNAMLGRLLVKEGMANLGGLKDVDERLKEINRIIISSCGTSYYAGLIGEYMLEEFAGIPVEVEYASEFRYRNPVIDSSTAVLAISQSGETADTLAAIREAKSKGALALGIVNVVGSTIARETDAGVYNIAGPEIGVASTKAFTSQLTILALLTLYLGRQREMSEATGKKIASELKKIPKYIEGILAQKNDIRKIAKKLDKYSNFLYLGRKYNFPIALEGALKIKEISYVHAEGYAAGEMKHGPIALIDKNFPSVFVVPKDSVYEKTISAIEEIKARGGKIIAVATEGDKEIAKLADEVIYIPKTLEMLTPLVAVVPLQLLAYYVGTGKGYDVDKPRNLAKSVTVE